MNFYDWLMRFKDVDLPIGDFAKDAQLDSDFPKNVKTWDQLEAHIRKVNPHQPELGAIKNVFNYYLAEQAR